MAIQYENLGPIFITAAKYEQYKLAGTLEVGREYKIVDWEAQEKLIAGDNVTIASDGKTISATDTIYTAGNGISITDNVISLNGNTSIAIYDNRIADANKWLTNGYTKTSAEIPTANLPDICTGNDRWGVLLYVAENNENKAGLQQYFPIDGTYKGRVFYRSVTGYSAGMDPDFGDWNIVPWSIEKQDAPSATPTTAGTYVLTLTVDTEGNKVFSWETK